jgi:hypothetical protein
VAIILTIAIIAIGVAQVAAVMQGYEMMHYQQSLEKLIEKKIRELESQKQLSESIDL